MAVLELQVPQPEVEAPLERRQVERPEVEDLQPRRRPEVARDQRRAQPQQGRLARLQPDRARDRHQQRAPPQVEPRLQVLPLDRVLDQETEPQVLAPQEPEVEDRQPRRRQQAVLVVEAQARARARAEHRCPRA